MEKEKNKKKPVRKAHSKVIANKSAAEELKKDAIEVSFDETPMEKKTRTVQLVILIIVAFLLLLFLANRTFFRTAFTKKIDDKEIRVDLPRFTYFISDKDQTLTFKTLRKSQNTINYYDQYLESESFDLYNCTTRKEPIYYNRAYKYFLYDVEVKKSFAVKTVTMKYSLENVDEICNTFK